MMFLISLILVLLFWAIERILGMPWDFHPDAETYATVSHAVAINIMDNPIAIFNNGHYAMTALLNSNVILITFCNCVLFSITNAMIYNYIKPKNLNINQNLIYCLILFGYLFNPYRMHLATTILKDTFIIFLLVHPLVSRKLILSGMGLLFYRVASIIYFALFIPKKYFGYFFVIAIVTLGFISDPLISHMDNMNEVDMQFREFDLIPSFQHLGIAGSILRAVVWPVISITGLFYLISPSLQYFPLALGSFIIILYCYLYIDFKMIDLLMPIFIMAIFALLVTGYTSYYRYIFPVLVVLPVYLKLVKNFNQKG